MRVADIYGTMSTGGQSSTQSTNAQAPNKPNSTKEAQAHQDAAKTGFNYGAVALISMVGVLFAGKYFLEKAK